jgi:thiol-disulfide isomerase/thioredoxin
MIQMKNITLAIYFILIIGCYSRRPAEKTGLEGKSLPSFNLLLSDSLTYFNTSNIPKGKPIALFYFGPNCPYSRAQMEEIIEDMSILKNIRFYIFTIYPYQDMKNFYDYYNLGKYPNITVSLDYTNFFGNYFETQAVPYLAIYGKDKRLIKAFIGKVYGKQIKEVSEK